MSYYIKNQAQKIGLTQIGLCAALLFGTLALPGKASASKCACYLKNSASVYYKNRGSHNGCDKDFGICNMNSKKDFDVCRQVNSQPAGSVNCNL